METLRKNAFRQEKHNRGNLLCAGFPFLESRSISAEESLKLKARIKTAYRPYHLFVIGAGIPLAVACVFGAVAMIDTSLLSFKGKIATGVILFLASCFYIWRMVDLQVSSDIIAASSEEMEYGEIWLFGGSLPFRDTQNPEQSFLLRSEVLKPGAKEQQYLEIFPATGRLLRCNEYIMLEDYFLQCEVPDFQQRMLYRTSDRKEKRRMPDKQYNLWLLQKESEESFLRSLQMLESQSLEKSEQHDSSSSFPTTRVSKQENVTSSQQAPAFQNQRKLTPEEVDELALYIEHNQSNSRKLFGGFLSTLVSLLANYYLWDEGMIRLGLSFLLLFVGLIALYRSFSYRQKAKSLSPDVQNRIVRRFKTGSLANQRITERLSVSGRDWSIEGKPADWRTKSLRDDSLKYLEGH